MKNTIVHGLCLAGLTALFLLSAGCGPAGCDSAVLIVTKTADTNDGSCDAADCSLREAVIESNMCPGKQTIQIPAGLYLLTLAGTDEDAAATGDLDIKADVTILGTDHPLIDGDLRDRVFEVFPGVTADLSGLIIQRGQARLGGGIYNRGTLNVNESTLQNNVAIRLIEGMDPGRGGAILSIGGGALGVYLSDIHDNRAEFGGGILVEAAAGATPAVMVSHTTMTQNIADSNGGALWLGEGVEATAIRFELENNNAGGNGGGIHNAGSLELTDGTIQGNASGSNGGAIYNSAAGTVISRQIGLQDNSSSTNGGGIYNDGMAHFYNSALVTNAATNGQGGGAFNHHAGAGLLLDNTTVSGNIAALGGGGIRNEDGSFQMMFVTIAENESEGINSSGSGEMKMRNTILSANPGGNCAGIQPDSIGHNIDDGNTCLLDEPTDLANTDPMLLPLAMNGSIRQTHALAAGSPAIDSADPDRCAGTDQRLVERPQGPNCDRGAHENEPLAAGGSGSIGGMVWRDLCALPDGPLPPMPPPGCIAIDDYYGANGILEPIEPGIPAVQVRLGAGACPAYGADLADTDAGGLYNFTGLAAGIYCVSIDALSEENVPALIPGGWSYPIREVTVAQTEIALGEGEIRSDANFGWDYQFDAGWPETPPTPTPAVTSTPTPSLLSFGRPWISTDHFYYLYGEKCTPLEVKFQIEVSDPIRVKSVGIFFSLEDKGSGERTEWSPVFAMNPLGNGRYALTMPATEIPGFDSYAEAWLHYRFVANEEEFKPLLYSDYFRDITLSRCGKPEVVRPTSTPTKLLPTPTPTPTPTLTKRSPNQTNK